MRKQIKHFSVAALFVALVLPGSVFMRAQEPAAAQKVSQGGEQTTPAAEVPEKSAEEQDENAAYLHSPMVVKLGAALGMKPEAAATAFTLFNFVVLAIGVGFVLLKTLPKTFRKRNTDIQKSLVDARTATEEATARLNKVEERLSKLDEKIAGMRAQSKADSARDQQRIKANIEEEKAKILAAAEQEIAAATTHAQRQIQQYAAELAIEQAVRKLVINAETDRLLIESFAHRLGGDKGGQN
ncbi:MAG: ATP synthase F0 subunit B [Acidobacteriaceae bacterium]